MVSQPLPMRSPKQLHTPCALLSCLFLFMFYTACRRLQDQPTNPVPHSAERFFTVPEGTAPAFLQIAAGLRRLEERDGFVDDYVNRAGFPRWEFGQPGSNGSGLLAAYPSIDPTDAKALSWAGLQDTNAWNTMMTNNPTQANNYLLRIAKHRVNTAGTPCN